MSAAPISVGQTSAHLGADDLGELGELPAGAQQLQRRRLRS